MTLGEWGKLLAKGIDRPRPFDKGQVSRFLDGSHTTEDLLVAICAYLQIPSPLIEPSTISEVEWFEAGVLIRKSNPERFKQLLRAVKNAAVAEARATLSESEVDRLLGVDFESQLDLELNPVEEE